MAANNQKKPGLLKNARKRVAAQADSLKAGAAAALREKAAGIREAIGPDKTEPVKQPERPFGRDEGGEDVKQVVWTGHTVQTRGGQAYFGAVGLTQGGYYRAAEVQVYGSGELWRWQGEKHTVKDDAQQSAEAMNAKRLNPQSTAAKAAPDEAGSTGRKSEKPEDTKMTEIPEHLKAQADAVRTQTGAQQYPVKDMGGAPPADSTVNQTAKLEISREQKLPEPDKG